MRSAASRLIIKSNSEFLKRYHELKQGDVVACMVNMGIGQEYLLLDLVQRGIKVFPAPVAQVASRSKCCQAELFQRWMHPLTRIVRKRSDMVRLVELYASEGVEDVITKLDRSDCGLGICKWRSAEDLFSNVVFSSRPPYPFVVQPFIPGCRDIRVVWIGDMYREAYWRQNSHGFRNNLHFGGSSGEYSLEPLEEAICSALMKRGDFPYAHIDLLKTNNGKVFFSEISLFGGLKGALIDDRAAADMRDAVLKGFLQALERRDDTA